MLAKDCKRCRSELPLAPSLCDSFIRGECCCRQASSTDDEPIEDSPAIHTETFRRNVLDSERAYYTIRRKEVRGKIEARFAPITGLDFFVRPELWRFVDLNPLLSLPLLPEQILQDEKFLKSRVPFLAIEDQPPLVHIKRKRFFWVAIFRSRPIVSRSWAALA